MTETLQKKISKSKKWIDYSSQQENDHSQQQNTKKDSHHNQNYKKQSHHNHKSKNEHQKNLLPLISTSHEPVKQHLLEDKKQLLQRLRQSKYDFIWIELKAKQQRDIDALQKKIEQLRKEKNPQIYSIYNSKDQKNVFNLKISRDLCEKWILEGFDGKSWVKLAFSRQISAPRKDFKSPKSPVYDDKNRDYKPVKQYQPQHTATTKYQPKYQEKQKDLGTNKYQPKYEQKIQKAEKYLQKTYQQKEPVQKKKYIEKNPLAQKLQQKVEQQLAEKKLQKKVKGNKQEKPKKNGKGSSKFYSKNPFQDLL